MANSFVKYDKADWHHDAADGDVVAMHLHTGFFLAWLAEKSLLNPGLQELAEPVLRREMTGQEFFQSIDGKFSSDDLNDKGNDFAQACFITHYLHDYEEFAGGRREFYQIQDTWENYEAISKLIDRRFDQWKTGNLKKSNPWIDRISDQLLVILCFLFIAVVGILLAWLFDMLSK